MLDERRSEVVRALVEEHIRTGEPVSSRVVLDATGLAVSTATIRSDLAALERDGYVIQPHTSAGRVPTSRAYRYYVDHLSPQRLRQATRARIAEFFSTVQLELSRLLKATSVLLSDITHYPAVVTGPGLAGEEVRAVHLVQLGAQTALVVLVTEAGRVSQEACRLPVPVTPRELDEAERVLVAAFAGRSLDGGLEPPAELLEAVTDHVGAVVSTVLEAIGRSRQATADIYVGGTRQMATVWEDLSTVHRVLEVLGREAMLLQILARAPGTAIQIGAELPVRSAVDMAVVSTTYDVGGTPAGRVGVIGPMRMDYRKAISVVEGVGQGLGESIGS